MATVTLEHLSKRYERDGALAVDDVSLTIADGEFMVLLGPVGLRQVDHAADDRRPREHHRGRALHRRSAR